MGLVQIANVERGWVWVWVEGGEVVVIVARVIEVGVAHIGSAEALRGLADVVDGGVDALVGGIEEYGEAATGADLVAAAIGTGVRIQHSRVHALIDSLDAVCVVVGDVGIRGPLDLPIYAAVDDHERVEVDDVHFADVGPSAILDLLILLLEECRIGRAIAAAIRLCRY